MCIRDSPAKHVAKSKRNPDKFCVFDKDGNEVKLFDKKEDAIEIAHNINEGLE